MKYAGGELPGIGLGVSLYDTLLDLVPSFVSGPAQRAEGWGAVEFGLPQVRNGIFSLSFPMENDHHFTKTGSRQTKRKLIRTGVIGSFAHSIKRRQGRYRTASTPGWWA
jgi:hypothetical protein